MRRSRSRSRSPEYLQIEQDWGYNRRDMDYILFGPNKFEIKYHDICTSYQQQGTDFLCAVHAISNAYDICISLENFRVLWDDFYRTKNVRHIPFLVRNEIDAYWTNRNVTKVRKQFDKLNEESKQSLDMTDGFSEDNMYFNYLLLWGGLEIQFMLYLLTLTRMIPHSRIEGPKINFHGKKLVIQSRTSTVHVSDAVIIFILYGKLYKHLYTRFSFFEEIVNNMYPDETDRRDTLDHWSNTENDTHTLAIRKNSKGTWCWVDSHGFVFEIPIYFFNVINLFGYELIYDLIYADSNTTVDTFKLTDDYII